MKRTYQRHGGKSTFKKALAAGRAVIVTPAGKGMRIAHDPPSGFLGDPFEVPPKSPQWRVNAYHKQTGRRLGPDADAVMNVPHRFTPAQRATALGLTAPQRRRFDHKLHKSAA